MYLLIGYMFLFIHRPFEVWPLLGKIQLERVYVLITLISWFFYPRKVWIRSLHTPAFIFFILAMVLSYLVSPYPDTGWFVLDKYLKQSVFYFLVLSTVSDAQMLRKLLIGFLVVMGIYLTHSYKEYRNGRHQYRMGIVRMIGVDETSGEPNAFGATFVYALPLTVPFWREASRLATRKKRLAARLLLVYLTLLSLLCVLATGSRQAFVGLVVLGVYVLLLSKRRLKNIVLLTVLAPAAWYTMPESMQNRYLTLIDPSYGPKNAQESAEGRTHGLYDGIELWEKSPVTGFGPGSHAQASGVGFQAHNLYGQVLGELGTFGAVAFACVVLSFFVNACKTWALTRGVKTPDSLFPRDVSMAVILVISIMLLFGNGSHSLYRYTWMWLAAFQSVAIHCLREEKKKQTMNSAQRLAETGPASCRVEGSDGFSVESRVKFLQTPWVGPGSGLAVE